MITRLHILPMNMMKKQLGKSEEEVNKHIDRFGVDYYPITIDTHCNILYDVGFSAVEVLWVSNMQAGLYAVKT